MQGKTDWIHTQNTEYFVLTQMIIDNVHLFAVKTEKISWVAELTPWQV